jgi:hypothetical protein
MSLRVVQIDGEPWFVAQDACRTLELAIDKKSGNVCFSPKRFTTINEDEVRKHPLSVNLNDDEVTTDLSSSVRGMQPAHVTSRWLRLIFLTLRNLIAAPQSAQSSTLGSQKWKCASDFNRCHQSVKSSTLGSQMSLAGNI